MLRIDPAARPLWRSPDAVQFGDDPVLAVLDPVPPGCEPVLAALVDGAPRARLEAVADEAGLPRTALDGMLAALGPVLARRRPSSTPVLQVGVDAPDDLGAALAALLHLPPAGDDTDLVVVAGHHLVRPAATVRWLQRDLPHLGLVFGDQAVVVGPLVVPGATPCLRCAEEHRLDEPARRAIGAQLLRRTGSLTARALPVRLRAALLVAEALSQRAAGAPTGLEGAALRMTPDGAVSRVPRPWHARCSCRGALPAA